MKPPPRLPAATVLALLCFAALVPSESAVGREGPGRAGGEPGRPIVKTRRIAPGLFYTKIVQRAIPRRTFILEMDPARDVTLDVTISEGALPARRALSRVVRAHDALAGVNGDYSGNGDPFHPLAQDGDLLQTSRQLGTLFAITADEEQTFFGRPHLGVVVANQDSGGSFRIARWNDGEPVPGEIVGYSPLGGTLEVPPSFSCSTRLLPTGPPTLAKGDGVDRDYVVDESACTSESMPRNGGVVLSTPPATDEAIELLALAQGTRMRLHWSFGWPGVLDAVGGAPLLLRDGEEVGVCRSGCGSQPRTGIGVTANGHILLVVIDGRRPRWSLGPTMTEFARIMRDLGAVTALNLDGGGSSEMVVEGEVVNRPSDGRERAISNAILVLPGADPGES